MAQTAICLLRAAHQRMAVAGVTRRVAQIGIRQLHLHKPLNDKDGKDLAEIDPAKLSIRDKLKLMMRQYGKVTLGVYLLFDVISLGSFYTLVKAGVDVSGLIEMIGLGNSKWMTPGASTAVVAFAAHKLFSPIRILLTVAATPYAVKLLQRMGYIETTPKTTIQEVKQEYRDVKQGVQVAIQSSRQQAQIAVRSYRMRVQSMKEQRRRKGHAAVPSHGKQAAERRTPH